MTYQPLLFDLRDAIAFITINRPDKLNALNDQVVDELADAAERVATEDAIKGAILSGAGQKAFVAGADIADLAKQGPFDGKARALRGQAMLRRLETCGKPVIAAVNGLPQVSRRRSIAWPRSARAFPSNGPCFARSAMSAPATNAFCPAPESIAPLIASSVATRSTASASSSTTWSFRAFSLSGRLMVMKAMASRRAKRRVW